MLLLLRPEPPMKLSNYALDFGSRWSSSASMSPPSRTASARVPDGKQKNEGAQIRRVLVCFSYDRFLVLGEKTDGSLCNSTWIPKHVTTHERSTMLMLSRAVLIQQWFAFPSRHEDPSALVGGAIVEVRGCYAWQTISEFPAGVSCFKGQNGMCRYTRTNNRHRMLVQNKDILGAFSATFFFGMRVSRIQPR